MKAHANAIKMIQSNEITCLLDHSMDLIPHQMQPPELQHIFTQQDTTQHQQLIQTDNHAILSNSLINETAHHFHLMTTVDQIVKPELPASPIHLDLQLPTIVQLSPSPPIQALSSSTLTPELAALIHKQPNQSVLTCNDKLDEIFDIVCNNEGILAEPNSLAPLTATNTTVESITPKTKILPTNKCNTKHCCSLCNKQFSAERYYKQHYNSVHLHNGPKRFKCMLCQRSFHTEKALQKHIDHEVYKPHNCDECERTFNRKPDLIRHSFVHRKAKPFTCTACQKSFIRSDQLTSHHKNCTLIGNTKGDNAAATTSTNSKSSDLPL